MTKTISQLPHPYSEMALRNQVAQGNERNGGKYINDDKDQGNFYWGETQEKFDWWLDVKRADTPDQYPPITPEIKSNPIYEGIEWEKKGTSLFEELFKTSDMETEEGTMTELEKSIWDEYGKHFSNRRLQDDEYPSEDVCDKCTGCGTTNVNGETMDCVKDRQEGDCFYKSFDYYGFGREVEALLIK